MRLLSKFALLELVFGINLEFGEEVERMTEQDLPRGLTWDDFIKPSGIRSENSIGKADELTTATEPGNYELKTRRFTNKFRGSQSRAANNCDDEAR